MATSYFGNRSAAMGDGPFYKLKKIPLLNKTNVERSSTIGNPSDTDAGIPVWRAAVANNVFTVLTTSTLKLSSINSAGTETVIANIDTTTYLASSVIVGLHLNTIDQCLYVLIGASGTTFRLIKVSDSGGAVTTIGSSFTPATTVNWPSTTQSFGTCYVDSGGDFRIIYRGFYHRLNKTTGAIVSQDTAITIGSFSLVGTNYLSIDGTTAATQLVGSGVSGTSDTNVPMIVNSASGIINHLTLPTEYIFDSWRQYDNNSSSGIIMVDDDKLYLGDYDSGAPKFGYVYRADFDQFLQSVVDWYTGA